MRNHRSRVVLFTMLAAWVVGLSAQQPDVDWPMVAKIREAGLQRSRVMDLEGYMTDTIQAEDLMKNAVVMASYAYHAAVHETRLPRKTKK